MKQNMQKKYLSCVPGVDGKASLVTAYTALRPWDGFSHPHQEHMNKTYSASQPLPPSTLFIMADNGVNDSYSKTMIHPQVSCQYKETSTL